MCAYLFKIEDQCSHAMGQEFKEAVEANCSNYEQMRLLVCAYLSRENVVCKRPYTILCQNYGFKRHLFYSIMFQTNIHTLKDIQLVYYFCFTLS